MNLNDIKVFIKVVEAESFASAGKTLDMPSTTVSRKVHVLEDSLGVKLLHRSTRKLSLTEEGRNYFHLCQQHLVAIEEANNLVMQAQSAPQGTFRITSPLDFATQYVHLWIEEFLQAYPKIKIELDVSDDYSDLVQNRIDIAFRSGTLKDSSLIARKIGPKQNICCASPEFLKTVTRLKTPKDLERYDCVIMGKSLQHNTWRFIEKGKDLDVSVDGRYASNSMRLVIESAKKGLGFAYIPIALAKPYLDSGELVQVLDNFKTPISSMFLIYQSHKYLAAPKRLFIDFIIDKTSPNPPWA